MALDERLEHIPTDDIANRGTEIIAAYAIAKLQEVAIRLRLMFKQEIDLIRAQSKAGNFGPGKLTMRKWQKDSHSKAV